MTATSAAPSDLDTLHATIAAIEPASDAALAAAADRWDGKTKPRGSLGLLEALGCRYAAIRGGLDGAPVQAAIVVAAGDHGVADEGVSAYPQAVTREMLANFARGGAAISVLAAELSAPLVVVDCGTVGEPLANAAIRACRIAARTGNIAREPAMTHAQALRAIVSGIALADELAADGVNVVALGEMGIANSTVAAALAAALTGADPAALCGPGTGLDHAGVRRKAAVVAQALRANPPDPGDPLGTLAALGGFELAFLAGTMLGAGARRIAVLLDGFIASSAALAAVALAPALAGRLIASHRSSEPGHRLVLAELRLEPLLDLGLRLGEGSGAALALPLLTSAVALLQRMATFDEAGVTDTGR
jgi:nicotinate-nucleotide--dimethylbenzimidazole phosphoribosyltransferase